MIAGGKNLVNHVLLLFIKCSFLVNEVQHNVWLPVSSFTEWTHTFFWAFSIMWLCGTSCCCLGNPTDEALLKTQFPFSFVLVSLQLKVRHWSFIVSTGFNCVSWAQLSGVQRSHEITTEWWRTSGFCLVSPSVWCCCYWIRVTLAVFAKLAWA